MQPPNLRALHVTSRVLDYGTWLIISGVVFYSLMTTTPFVAAHSAWEWSGPALGLMMDAAFIMALQADSVLARYRVGDLGPWPRRFRWYTGLGTIFLNIWGSVEKGDRVGIAVHLLGPGLLLIVSEVAPIYRRAMADIIDRVTAETAAAKAAAAPDPDPERAPVPAPEAETETEEEYAAPVPLFPAPPRQRRAHAATPGARANSVKARGLALMAEAVEAGRDPLTPEELADKLDCSPRHGLNIVKAWEGKTG